MDVAAASPSSRRWLFWLGFVLSVTPLLGLAEVYLRQYPPRDLYDFLGEDCPREGPFRGDPEFVVNYRSWETFQTDYAERLRELGPLDGGEDRRPVWAFFGNSFAQMQGALADTAKANVTDRRVFHLARNEPYPVRLAQIDLLMKKGLRPERVFIVLMPVDTLVLGPQPLATWHVTERGAITYRPRPAPGPLNALTEQSRVGLSAWVRTGRHVGNPSFNRHRYGDGLEEPLRGDLVRMFGNLAPRLKERGVPATVLLLPTHEQVVFGKSCGFQDAATPFLREQGYDVFDPRRLFRDQPDKPGLFLPDKHFTPRGNELLLAELRRHLERMPHALLQDRRGPSGFEEERP